MKLADAVMSEDADQIRSRIDAGADVDEVVDGTTALHTAIEHLKLNVVQLLLERGADVEKEDERFKWSPLVHAIEVTSDQASQRAFPPKIELIELLLRHGADTGRRCSFGVTPLEMARQQCNAAVSKLLRAHGGA